MLTSTKRTELMVTHYSVVLSLSLSLSLSHDQITTISIEEIFVQDFLVILKYLLEKNDSMSLIVVLTAIIHYHNIMYAKRENKADILTNGVALTCKFQEFGEFPC